MTLLAEKYEGMMKTFKLKEEEDIMDFLYLPIVLWVMHADFCMKAEQLDMPTPVITRIVDEKIPGISVSDTHKEGRAIDYRAREWSPTAIYKMLRYMNEKYEDFGAISFSDGKPRALVYHEGTSFHWHMQVRRDINNFSWEVSNERRN